MTEGRDDDRRGGGCRRATSARIDAGNVLKDE
jgi:hypothetical protein